MLTTMLLFTVSFALLASAYPGPQPSASPPCRFVKDYSQNDLLADPTAFLSDYLYWESKFHVDDVAYNAANGMSYDGSQINYLTGEATKKHPFSAASKEALQIMVYAQALSGSEHAARFIAPYQPQQAAHIVGDILTKKLDAYTKFNESFPGFGGMLPWFLSNGTDIRPTLDWENRIPALDNGELLWAVYALIQALEDCPDPGQRQLAKGWQEWLDYAKTTAPQVFYMGNGSVCAVTALEDQTQPVSSAQNYSCENKDRLDDPYEGELFTWWIYFFGDLSSEDKEALWQAKRKKLVSIEYEMGGIGPVTVQKGFWFSSHEPWKLLELPYLDVDLVRRIHDNGERARTCNSVITSVPGMFASVNNITDPATDEIVSYISPAGIPSIASQQDQYLEVITPYSVWPTLLSDQKVALAWLRNMLLGKKMQNPYGTTESTRIDGTGISALLTWDSKILTVAALSGGVQDLVRTRMQNEGIYEEFVAVVQREHAMVFEDGGIMGEDVEFCLPGVEVQEGGLVDFTMCD